MVRNDAASVDELLARRPAGIVLSPGPGRPEDAGVCLELLGRLGGRAGGPPDPAGPPVLGVCLGHQAMGAVFGARIVQAPELMHGKTSEVRHDGREIFEGLPSPFEATRYHSLVVAPETLPPELEAMAWSDDGVLQAVRHRGCPGGACSSTRSRSSPRPVRRCSPTSSDAATRTDRSTEDDRPGDQTMTIDAHQALNRLLEREDLTREEMETLFGRLMDGEVQDPMKAALLVALRMKGESPGEIAGAAAAMRRRVVPIPHGRERVVDTCGTGGDRRGTFNISTAAAFVAAAGGVPVAKHGNRSVSSRSGSADVLAALGVDIEVSPATAGRALDEIGIAFLFAPRLHPAMREVMPVRRSLAVRTVFNVLGPLTNPAGARRQVLGVYAEELVEPIARVLAQLGSEHAVVVHGADGLDEITTTGETLLAEVREGAVSLRTVEPEALGIGRAALSDLAGGSPEDNARAMARVLAGERDAQAAALADVTAANAGGALWVGGVAASLEEGVARAREVLASGAALETLERLKAYREAR